jgi:protein involved in polysaccharide export with SLBB domain
MSPTPPEREGFRILGITTAVFMLAIGTQALAFQQSPFELDEPQEPEPTRATAPEGSGSDAEIVIPDHILAVWYDTRDPAGTFRFNTYDIKKGEYDKAKLARLLEDLEHRRPEYIAKIRSIYLAREIGTTDQNKLESAIEVERQRSKLAPRVKPGDVLEIDVLQTLPGRPMSGLRVVRPDGTISLNWQGDLPVAGLNRVEIKLRLINLLRKSFPEKSLGLIRELDDDPEKGVRVDAVESDRVYVDDAPLIPPSPDQLASLLEDQRRRNQPAVQPGDVIEIAVLEALPGRPIGGLRIVRPDGTISLKCYGDLQVAGMDRSQIKTALITHLRRYMPDEILGLDEIDPDTGLPRIDRAGLPPKINPRDSDRVFVDESPFFPTTEQLVTRLQAQRSRGVAPIQRGDLIEIDVLEGLSGRPLRGLRIVRQDGTISLDWYGNLRVEGLNRSQVKERLVLHMRKYLSDEALGLGSRDPEEGRDAQPIHPAQSDRVFVDDAPLVTPAFLTRMNDVYKGLRQAPTFLAVDPAGEEPIKLLPSLVERADGVGRDLGGGLGLGPPLLLPLPRAGGVAIRPAPAPPARGQAPPPRFKPSEIIDRAAHAPPARGQAPPPPGVPNIPPANNERGPFEKMDGAAEDPFLRPPPPVRPRAPG